MNWQTREVLQALVEQGSLHRFGNDKWMVKTDRETFYFDSDLIHREIFDQRLAVRKIQPRTVLGKTIEVEYLFPNRSTYIALLLKDMTICEWRALDTLFIAENRGEPLEIDEVGNSPNIQSVVRKHMAYWTAANEEGQRFLVPTYSGRSLWVNILADAERLRLGQEPLHAGVE